MSSEADTTSATATVATPTKVAAAAAPESASATESGPASAPTTPSKETDEARSLLVQGKRHLLVKDYFSAVTALAKGVELLANRFGDTAPELGDAYFTYGRALLELARSESGVLGMNEDGEAKSSEDDEEEEDDDEEEGEDDGEENGKEGAAEENGKEAEEKKEGEAAPAEAAATNGKAEAKANGNGTEEANGVKENGDAAVQAGDAADVDQTLKEEEEEGDVNNLQLAWEVLELAKNIFQKQLETAGEGADEKQTSLKLSEVHLKLGEVGVESESYSTAVEDMKACLALQRAHLDADDRRVAETLYNMGMAFSLANEFDSAIEQFKAAAEQISMRMANLEKKKAQPVSDKDAAADPFYTVQGEIDELKALLPEIKDKVSDMQDFKKETVRRMMDGLAEASAKQSSTADGAGPSSASAPASSSSSDKPVSSVAHLVKRKPKDEAAPAVGKVEKTEDAADKEEKKGEKTVEAEKTKTEVKEKTVEAEQTKTKTEAEESEASVDRKRKPEASVEVEDSSKKAKVEEDAPESKPSE